MLTELTQRYMEPHRRYHTFTHVIKMIKLADILGIELDATMTWAIWCHDVVYKIPANPMDNEEESAEFCAYYMEEAGFDDDLVKRAKDLILATGKVFNEQVSEITREQWTIVGLDLYCLGNRCSYESAAALLWEESGHLTEEQWCRERSKFLNGIRNRPYIISQTFFRNKHDYNTWHQVAWRNIDNELEELKET